MSTNTLTISRLKLDGCHSLAARAHRKSSRISVYLHLTELEAAPILPPSKLAKPGRFFHLLLFLIPRNTNKHGKLKVMVKIWNLSLCLRL